MTKNTSSNRAVVPEAKGALDRFKFEVANELGVPLTDGYNGNLTSKQNGSVGGYMVKKNDRTAGTPDVRKFPERTVLIILSNEQNS
ncbi:Small, acid-soluble spore proteins, alpha/beta type [Blautia obeum A2-162]|uniref:Small, acid-soluble spore proteins, alpha/beta type n=1 Tax=Blautia obeum A2-162 TaxID=657314 RepID=D4LT09_9FIRM|nr:alpha/beta-type small acid-soluble spore protein [Blautia obeum]CBL23917.1 Small, acid-soluble spore proteins, alpha/beta type [Blautia obeum A2-162]